MSLLEVLFACGLVAILLVVLGMALDSGQSVFRNVNGNADALLELRKAGVALRRDLLCSTMAGVRVAAGRASLSSANDSSALVILSNQDPTSGQPRYRADGSPLWMRNILYYAVVPQRHEELFGFLCPGGLGPDGLDDRCPHKVLIRKVIDTGATTDGTLDTAAEQPLTGSLTAWLTRPNGFSTAGMQSESGVQTAQIVCRSLLWFEARADAAVVDLDIRAVSLPRAQRAVAVGSAPLHDSPYTRTILLSLHPQVDSL